MAYTIETLDGVNNAKINYSPQEASWSGYSNPQFHTKIVDDPTGKVILTSPITNGDDGCFVPDDVDQTLVSYSDTLYFLDVQRCKECDGECYILYVHPFETKVVCGKCYPSEEEIDAKYFASIVEFGYNFDW